MVVEEKYKCTVTVKSPILPWIVRHASYVYNRFQTKKNGRTPYEELTMQKFKSPLLEFSEVVLKRDQGDRKHKLAILWEKGLWLGRALDTGEHIIGCPGGIAKARAVRRLPTEEERWAKDFYEKMVWLPWATTKEDLDKIADEWTPTPGCKACESDRTDLAHNKRCLDRQKEWNSILEHRKEIQGDTFLARQRATPGAAPREPQQASASSPSVSEAQVQPAPAVEVLSLIHI